jgi:hypothetical protein
MQALEPLGRELQDNKKLCQKAKKFLTKEKGYARMSKLTA